MMLRVAKSGLDSYSNIRDEWDLDELLDADEWLEYQSDLEQASYDDMNNDK
jgi:hypothetical protein